LGLAAVRGAGKVNAIYKYTQHAGQALQASGHFQSVSPSTDAMFDIWLHLLTYCFPSSQQDASFSSADL